MRSLMIRSELLRRIWREVAGSSKAMIVPPWRSMEDACAISAVHRRNAARSIRSCLEENIGAMRGESDVVEKKCFDPREQYIL